MEFYFRQQEVPRTVGRTEWYRIWRWTRIQRKELALHREHRIQSLLQVPPKLRQRMIDEIVNPPLLLGPYMDKSHQ